MLYSIGERRKKGKHVMRKLLIAFCILCTSCLSSLAQTSGLQQKMNDANAAEQTALSLRSSLTTTIDAAATGIRQIDPLDGHSLAQVTNVIYEYERVSFDYAKSIATWQNKVESAVRFASSLSSEKRLPNQERIDFQNWFQKKKQAARGMRKPYIPPDVLRADNILRKKRAAEQMAKRLTKT